jgi:hypothetical protein
MFKRSLRIPVWHRTQALFPHLCANAVALFAQSRLNDSNPPSILHQRVVHGESRNCTASSAPRRSSNLVFVTGAIRPSCDVVPAIHDKVSVLYSVLRRRLRAWADIEISLAPEGLPMSEEPTKPRGRGSSRRFSLFSCAYEALQGAACKSV